MDAKKMINMKRCLNCPVGHRVIGDFFDLYPLFVKQQKENHRATADEMNDIDDYISSISTTLMLPVPKSNNLDVIISLADSPKKLTKSIEKASLSNRDNECCLYALNSILYPIKVILATEKENNYIGDQIKEELSKIAIDVMLMMNEVLEDNNIFVDVELTAEEKMWTKVYRDSLSVGQAKKVFLKLRSILTKYCLAPKDHIRYTYCAPMYSDKATEIEYDGKMYRDCQSEGFIDYINSIKAHYSIDNDWNDLTSDSVRIIQQYLVDSPKRFGALLSRVMNYQGLTSQKIVKLWDSKNSASAVDRLKKDVKHELSESELSSLLRILLVSAEVLKTGNGKIYGNWNDVLETPRDSEDWEKLQKAYNTDKVTELNQGINEDISKFIHNYNDVASMVHDNSDFFTEDSYNVYSNEQDYDYQAMYDDMLEPHSYHVLLSVLKKIQKTNSNE